MIRSSSTIQTHSIRRVQTPGATSLLGEVFTRAPVLHWLGPRARVCIERLLDRTTEITIAEDKHGPVEDRHYQYVPTFILRGLTELHLEFTL